MSILTAENVGLSFGAFDLFKGITVTVPNDGKIGFIGPNGIGKTSLLLILAGIHAPTEGRVHIAKGRRLGYLRQEAVDAFADRDNTVYAEMLSVFNRLHDMQSRLHELERAMEHNGHTDQELEDLLTRYGELQIAFEQAGGYTYDLQIQQTLQGLGLGKQYWDMPLSHLSGGQKTRALLARLLLEKPDLLMLDEPTNHLDIEAVEWLENTLRDWQGAVLIVSHDRYFLDNTVNTIWEMKRSGIELYSGNYSSYIMQRQDRWEYYQRVFEEEKARLQGEADFVQRNWVRASTHARALGVLRRLSRDIAIVENYGVMALRSGKQWSEMGLSADRPLDVIDAIRRVNAIQPEMSRPPQIRPRMATTGISGTIVVRAHNVTIGYPGNVLFNIKELELRRGENVALLGPNGTGKTTFLRVMLREMEPLKGEVYMGAGLHIGYFAQAHDALTSSRSVLEELLAQKPMDDADARNHLAQYLFRGDDVFKPVNALSGGERARLALAILALQGTNFLMLDEPTNHLDIPAREALQEVLENYPGTILLVSHDRYLIDRLATQIWDLRDKSLHIFKGSYREYTLRGLPTVLAPHQTRQTLLTNRPLIKVNSRDAKRKQEALTQLEERIRQHEGDVQRLSREMQKAGQKGNHEHVHQLGWQLAQTQAKLDELMSEWERMAV